MLDLVINLLPDDSEHALPGENALITSQGVRYVHIPVDFSAPQHADFVAFADAMDSRTQSKSHVHCAANFRASAFLGLYLLSRGLCDVETADSLMADIWNPADYPAWATFIADERRRIRSDESC